MENYNVNKTEHFKKLFSAFDTVRIIDENIEKLYQSAALIDRKDLAVDSVADLQEIKNNLLRQRVRFIAFIATLDPREAKVLEMRCEKSMGWKRISAALGMSDTNAKRIFGEVSRKAEKYGGIF